MTNNKYKYLIFSLFILVVILHHLLGYLGHYGWDDMHYALLAQNFLDGTLPFDDHYSYRWPTILITAFTYKLFGVNDFASALPSMFISLGILGLVFSILKRSANWVLFVGLSLITLSNWFIFYTDKIMPDIYVAFFILCAVYTIYRYKYHSAEDKPLSSSIVLALSLFFGLLSKETILLFLPVLIYLFVVDVFIYKKRKFWVYTIIAGAGILTIYFLLLYFITGDAFIRFKAILNNRYVSECSYHLLPTSVVLKRVFYDFFEMFIYHGMFLPIIFVAIAVFQKQAKKLWLFKDEVSFFSIISILLILSSNFMSISPTEYIPMCIDPRHYLFIVPIAGIASALIIEKYLEKTINKYLIIGGLLITAIGAFFINVEMFWTHYLPITLLFGVFGFISSHQKWAKIGFSIILFAILIIIPIQNGNAYRNSGYNIQKQAVLENIIKKEKECIIISNEVQTRFGRYYNEFKKDNKLNFVSFENVTQEELYSSTKKIVILNKYTLMLSNQNDSELPFYATVIDSNYSKVIFKDEATGIFIYELDKVAAKYIESTNGFEEKQQYWNEDKNQLSTEHHRGGLFSFSVKEYSATLKVNLDEIQPELVSDFVIEGGVYHLYKDSTEANIVVSIENDEGVYFWESAGLNYHDKNDEEWKNTRFSFPVSLAELKPNSQLKMYVWNPQKKQCIIDDFYVSIIGFK